MKKIINYIKKNAYLLLSIFCPLIIICVIYKLNKVSPFGNNSLLKVDFYHQYGPMLVEFINRIKSGSNLIYSFNSGLGLPLFRNYFNYLSSPINIIMILFKHKNLLTSYSFIIGIKAILSCVTCSYYIKKKFNINNIYILGISILYAYSAYFTAYYWNIMWIDGLYVLPIITLGIENIVNKNEGLLYTLALTYMLYTNYFIGYMLCIYSCIYFIAYLIIKTNKLNIKEILKKCLRFGICSLIAGLLLAWELIPLYSALKTTNATMGTIPTSQYYAFTIIDFFKNHITGVNSTVFASDISNAPNVSFGILSIPFILTFIINNKITLKRKIVLISLLIILLASFYIAPIDYIWHAFHVPNDLPYRYSFIYTFIFIIISAYSLKNIKNISYIKMIVAFVLTCMFIVYIYLSKYNNIDSNMILINFMLIVTYFLIYSLYYFFPNYIKISSILFLTVCSLECIVSINHNWNISQDINNFYSDYNDTQNIINSINKDDKDLFYRIEKTDNLTLNDPAWYNYHGQETFSSMAYNNLAKLNYDLGMPGNEINSYYYKQNTPIYDMMFNIKYTIGKNKDTKRYKLYKEINGIESYKFKYNIGLMYAVNKTTVNWNNNYINPLEYQNDFISRSTNIDNIFHRLILKEKETILNNTDETIVKYIYDNESDNIYAYTDNSNVNYIIVNNRLYYKDDVDIDDISVKLNTDLNGYYSYDEPYVINDYTNNDEIVVYISFKNYLSEEINIYTIDNDKFIKAYDTLKLNSVNINYFKENNIKGNIKLKEKSMIYTSIPYDDGWKVYCNNKTIRTYKINNTLLGFDLPKGNNNIELKYIPKNIDIGIGISVTSLILSTMYLIIKKKTNHQD